MYKSLLFLHIFFAMIWIGGMVFSLLFLHPALKDLSPEEARKSLARRVMKRFLLAVWLSVAVLFLTGTSMWWYFRQDFSNNILFHIKLFLFGVMVLNLAYIYFWLLRKEFFRHISNFVWINLFLGMLVTLIITYIR